MKVHRRTDGRLTAEREGGSPGFPEPRRGRYAPRRERASRVRSLMWVFPLAAAAVALVFAALLGRQFLSRRRPYQLLWAIALLMYASSSLALFLGVLSGWTTAEVRVYCLFGAVLTVPYLAMGEIYLLVKNPIVVNGFL